MEKQLETYIHKNIPISLAMGIQVKAASPQKVILKVPFENNINHQKTVFGGSLHAAATLACWSLLYLNLKKINEQKQVIIASSQIDYLLPVDDNFEVECLEPAFDLWQHFIKTLKAKGKARITLYATIKHKEKLAVTYEGMFVAI